LQVNSERLKKCEDFSQLTRRLTLLQINDKPQPRAGSESQVTLGNYLRPKLGKTPS
jgi:hypothetical protein